jgi:hypothetical protein
MDEAGGQWQGNVVVVVQEISDEHKGAAGDGGGRGWAGPKKRKENLRCVKQNAEGDSCELAHACLHMVM